MHIGGASFFTPLRLQRYNKKSEYANYACINLPFAGFFRNFGADTFYKLATRISLMSFSVNAA